MNHGQDSKNNLITVRVIRLHAVFSGTVTGLLAGVGLFVATNWLVIKGGENVGFHLGLLSEYLYGYEVSFIGSLIGLLYATAIGFVIGSSVSWLYNKFVAIKRGNHS